jgi:hypothetical protein
MTNSDSAEARLRAILDRVSPADAETLLAFGEFLAARSPQTTETTVPAAAEAPAEISREPLPIPRPEAETVMLALKRLAATYPMLDRKKLLDVTSTLVMQHLVAGRDRVEVIDELEVVFRREYEQL